MLLYKEFCNIEQHLWQHVLDQMTANEGNDNFLDNLIDLKKNTIHEIKCILSQRRTDLPDFPLSNFIILNRTKASDTDPANVVNLNVELCQYCTGGLPNTESENEQEEEEEDAQENDGGAATTTITPPPLAKKRAKKRKQEGSKKVACGCRLQDHMACQGK